MQEAGGGTAKELQAGITCQAVAAESVIAGAPAVKRLVWEQSLKEEGTRTEQVLGCIGHLSILYSTNKDGDILNNA